MAERGFGQEMRTRRAKSTVTFADVFRAYVKPSLKGRLVLRKRGASRRSERVIDYNRYLRECFSGDRAPIKFAKRVCMQERNDEYTCSRIETLRSYLSRVLSAIRRAYEANPNSCPETINI